MKLIKCIIAVLCVLCWAGNGLGATVYVNDAADPGGDCTSAALTGANCACQTLAAAVIASAASNTIEVTEGSGPYDERFSPDAAKDNQIWNFNGCIISREQELNALVSNGDHMWVESTHASHDNQYLLTKFGAEIAVNGDMELSASWTGSSTDSFGRSDEQAHGGTYSYKVVSNDAGNPLMYQTSPALTGADGYIYEVWIYGDGVNTVDIEIAKQGGGDDDKVYTGVVPAAWTRFCAIVTPDDSAAYFIKIQGVTGDCTFYVDDVSFKKAATPTYFSTITSVVVDGQWRADSHSLHGVSSFGITNGNNWGFEDYDELGFDTIYIYYGSGIDPTDSGIEILIPTDSYVASFSTGKSGHTINNAIFKSANETVFYTAEDTTFNRCEFWYADAQGINILAGGSISSLTAQGCKFIDCGHRGVNVSSSIAPTLNIFGNLFSGCHLELRCTDNTQSPTWNIYNNVSYNLLAGAIQADVNAGATINEDYNLFHIECDNPHSNKKLGFTSGTNQWATTGAHSIPPSQDTSLACSDSTCPGVSTSCGVDPLFVDAANGDFHLMSGSSCINAGIPIVGIHDNDSTPATDLDGESVYLVNIGLYGNSTNKLYFNSDATGTQNGTVSYPYSSFTDFTFGEDYIRDDIILMLKGDLGALDLSSVANDPAVTVKSWGNSGTFNALTPLPTAGNCTIELGGSGGGGGWSGSRWSN